MLMDHPLDKLRAGELHVAAFGRNQDCLRQGEIGPGTDTRLFCADVAQPPPAVNCLRQGEIGPGTDTRLLCADVAQPPPAVK